MRREVQSNGAQAEYLSPWSSGHGWSFNPQKISVVSPHSRRQQDYSHSANRLCRSISTIQIVTLGLIVLSIGLLAAITALLVG